MYKEGNCFEISTPIGSHVNKNFNFFKLLNLKSQMPRSNICEDGHREFLEKVWLKKSNHNITVGGVAF